jgi:ABC-type transport system involved in cytochrome c biogenesis permease subunit
MKSLSALNLMTMVLALTSLAAAQQSQPVGFDLEAFGRLPVTADGRVKPLDSVARSSLMIISDRQSFRIGDKKQSAIRWLTDVLARPKQSSQYLVFRIDDPAVLDVLHIHDAKRTRFSFSEIMANAQEIEKQVQMAQEKKSSERDAYQRHMLELYGHLIRYMRLSRKQTPYAVPPLGADEEWTPLADSLHVGQQTGEMHPAAAQLQIILAAYHDGKPEVFNAAVAQYQQLLNDKLPALSRKAGFEVFFNQLEPFSKGIMLYVVVFLLICAALLLTAAGRTAGARRVLLAALVLTILTFLLHTFGIGARIYMQGRPPVTNLYSSAVFIGWVAVLLGLLLEMLYRNGVGLLLASFIGVASLIVAHNLAAGDTMEMMQAVLDSNFWLATHVIAITIGYSATYLAGFIGIAFILLGVFTPWLKGDAAKHLGNMMYGVIAFALLFSFVGTVLGGIWADQSWGRFWGWDPKENGAVLIVIINVLILHARWAGLIQQRGMAVLAVFGNIVTTWSWFGTNMLGVGLHSYGFMDTALLAMLSVIAIHCFIMILGMLPFALWISKHKPLAQAQP